MVNTKQFGEDMLKQIKTAFVNSAGDEKHREQYENVFDRWLEEYTREVRVKTVRETITLTTTHPELVRVSDLRKYEQLIESGKR